MKKKERTAPHTEERAVLRSASGTAHVGSGKRKRSNEVFFPLLLLLLLFFLFFFPFLLRSLLLRGREEKRRDENAFTFSDAAAPFAGSLVKETCGS